MASRKSTETIAGVSHLPTGNFPRFATDATPPWYVAKTRVGNEGPRKKYLYADGERIKSSVKCEIMKVRRYELVDYSLKRLSGVAVVVYAT